MSVPKIVSFEYRDTVIAGILINGRVYPATALNSGYRSVQDILDDWPNAEPSIYAWCNPSQEDALSLGEVTLAAPLPRPRAIYCAGANYRDHVENMARIQNLPPEPDPRELGLKPWHFMKSTHTVVSTGATVVCQSERLDWEAELAVVIGIMGRDIPIENALAHVAGFLVANDLSARDRVSREGVNDLSPFKFDWIAHKNFDGSCPLGPWIVPARAIPAPQNLGIRLWVNGAIRQDSNTSQMIFSIAEQISHLSTSITLHPGDVLLTGTPAGTATEHGERLVAGDEVRIEIDAIGELITHIA